MSKPEINVTPLIDVLLVLLIIFMVVSPVKPGQFETKIPSESKDSKITPHPHTIVISIDKANALSLNAEKLEASAASPGRLIERLKEVFTAREGNLVYERTVFIKAPKGIDYGTVAKVVDAVKMSGASPISLQIDRLE